MQFKKSYPFISILFCVLFLAGCANVNLNLHPKVDTTKIKTWKKHGELQLVVQDARDNKVVGDPASKGIITGFFMVPPNVADTIRDNLEKIAIQRGFALYNNAKKSLTIKLLLTQGEFVRTFTTVGNIADITIETVAKNKLELYDHIYRCHDTYRVYSYLNADDYTKQYERALSNVLQQIANDQKLWDFLQK